MIKGKTIQIIPRINLPDMNLLMNGTNNRH